VQVNFLDPTSSPELNKQTNRQTLTCRTLKVYGTLQQLQRFEFELLTSMAPCIYNNNNNNNNDNDNNNLYNGCTRSRYNNLRLAVG